MPTLPRTDSLGRIIGRLRRDLDVLRRRVDTPRPEPTEQPVFTLPGILADYDVAALTSPEWVNRGGGAQIVAVHARVRVVETTTDLVDWTLYLDGVAIVSGSIPQNLNAVEVAADVEWPPDGVLHVVVTDPGTVARDFVLRVDAAPIDDDDEVD